jgi:hypothetical protein
MCAECVQDNSKLDPCIMCEIALFYLLSVQDVLNLVPCLIFLQVP